MEKDKYIIVYDEKVGGVWMPECGGLKITTSNHAKQIEKYIELAYKDELSVEDETLLTEYLNNSFANIPKLQVQKCINLMERKTLDRLEILVANDCNLNCRYCYANGGTYKKVAQHMTPERVIDYLNALFDIYYDNVKKVTFFGGEPTLCPDTIDTICQYFEQAYRKNIIKDIPIYTMVTNATLIDEKMAKIIQKNNIVVTVSVDGPKEINDILRIDKEKKGTFEKIKKGINQIKKVGSKVTLLEATYTSKHQEAGYSKKDVVNYLQDYFGINNVMIADCEESTKDKELICKEKDEEIYNNGDHLEMIKKRIHCKEFIDTACGSGYNSMALMPNGEIYPCHFFIGKPEYCMAIYKEKQFDFTNYGNVMALLESSHHLKNEQCKECWAKYTCTTCAAHMLLNTNTACDLIRNRQKAAILECVKKYSGTF